LNIALVWKILRILLIVVIVIMAIPLYAFFAFGSLFAFDSPDSFNLVNVLKLLIMDFTAFITPIGMIAGIILGHKINSKYYLLILVFPILLYMAMKWFFPDI
jgi:hypothetical protein